MATIVSIKQKIEQLDAGSFQVLCDAYLSREGYPNPVSLGTKAGTQKTTQGTPDTYYISKYNTDYEKMESLFSVLSELCDDRKKDYISYLMTVNADPELFRRIPLCPTSYSWSGSAVPLYSKWADYLKGLLPLFSGIQFLQHKKVVNDEIEHLSKMIERAEIEDLLQG